MEYELIQYRLIKNVPLLRKSIYFFDTETGHVFGSYKGKQYEYPLRQGLAGYLWLLRTERGYFRKVK